MGANLLVHPLVVVVGQQVRGHEADHDTREEEDPEESFVAQDLFDPLLLPDVQNSVEGDHAAPHSRPHEVELT